MLTKEQLQAIAERVNRGDFLTREESRLVLSHISEMEQKLSQTKADLTVLSIDPSISPETVTFIQSMISQLSQ